MLIGSGKNRVASLTNPLCVMRPVLPSLHNSYNAYLHVHVNAISGKSIKDVMCVTHVHLMPTLFSSTRACISLRSSPLSTRAATVLTLIFCNEEEKSALKENESPALTSRRA